MSHFDFVIPGCRDDLLHQKTGGEYIVKDVVGTKEVVGKVQECYSSVKCDGPEFIIEDFDTMYSVLLHFRLLAPEARDLAWQIILLGVNGYTQTISMLLEDGDLTHDVRVKYLNMLNMLMYIQCQLMEAFESLDVENIEVTGKGGGRKRHKSDSSWDWDGHKHRGIQLVYQLLQPPLNNLWDPPQASTEFVDLVANLCYKLLEHSSISLVRCKSLRDSIFQVLGTLIQRYGHGLSFSIKIVQLLRHFDHLPVTLAQGVVTVINGFNCRGVIGDLVREISSSDGLSSMVRETNNANSNTNSIASRGYSSFLAEITKHVPDVIRPNIGLLLKHLDGDCYAMRNCVLGILGEIISSALRKENQDERSKDLRDQFLDCLQDHIHDTNAFVRSKVLQIWQKLFNEKAVPMAFQTNVLDLVIGRLKDKSTNVRKAAMQLLTTVLQERPYDSTFVSKYRDAKQELKKLIGGDTRSEGETCWEEMEEQVCIVVKDIIDKGSFGSTLSENADLQKVLQKLVKYLNDGKYARAACLFMEVLSSSPDVIKMCVSTDKENQCESGEVCLLMKNEKFVTNLMKRIYLDQIKQNTNQEDEEDIEEGEDEREEVKKQRNLVNFYKGAIEFNQKFLSALPPICILLRSKQFADVNEAINFFVTLFELGIQEAIIGVRKMLTLVWSTEPGVKEAVVTAYKRLYIKANNVNPRAQALEVVKNLTTLVLGVNSGELTSLEELVCEFVRTKDIGMPCFQILWERITNRFPDTKPEESSVALVLISMMAGAEPSIIHSNVNVLVADIKLGDGINMCRVEDICTALLKMVPAKQSLESTEPPLRFANDHTIFLQLEQVLITGQKIVDDPGYVAMASKAISTIYNLSEQPNATCSRVLKALKSEVCGSNVEDSIVLSRYLFVLGHIAICHLQYLDTSVFRELKRREILREKHREKKGRRSARQSDRNTKNEEDEIMGAVADDTEAELIKNLCEKEIITGTTLLAKESGVVIHVCSHPEMFCDVGTRAAAASALAKCMMVSSAFCEQHLQLLFTIMEKSNEETIRANCIIALGDLTFRFPNLLEPWTPNMYKQLRDTSLAVRRNTLAILTHLIIKDMIKVKGLISDIAMCLVDKDDKIAGMTKVFFLKLSQKTNSLYNVLPDIISRLSNPDASINEQDFQLIMKYIIILIQKDKQLESLVEKLCHRFLLSDSERQWRDISYCLSLFQYSERSIKKLHENMSCYANKLHETHVYEVFLGIIKAARKIKADMKVFLDEFEHTIQELHSKGSEEEAVAQKAQDKVNKNIKKKPGVTPARRTRRKQASSSEEESSESEERKENKRSRRRVKKVSSPEESSEEEQPIRKKAVRNGKSHIQMDDSSSADGGIDVSRHHNKVCITSNKVHSPEHKQSKIQKKGTRIINNESDSDFQEESFSRPSRSTKKRTRNGK